MNLDTLHILKRFGIVLAASAIALAMIGCSESDTPENPPSSRSASPSPSPAPQAEIPEFPRLDGVTTAEEYASFAAVGAERWQRAVPGIEQVTIPSTADDYEQPALWLPPEGEGPQPLLVVVHSWSADYLNHIGIPFAEWAEDAGWAMIAPDFRGVNDDPDSTGSDLVVQDVIDAIDYAAETGDIDEDRV